jgi:hypothetical protein
MMDTESAAEGGEEAAAADASPAGAETGGEGAASSSPSLLDVEADTDSIGAQLAMSELGCSYLGYGFEDDARLAAIGAHAYREKSPREFEAWDRAIQADTTGELFALAFAHLKRMGLDYQAERRPEPATPRRKDSKMTDHLPEPRTRKEAYERELKQLYKLMHTDKEEYTSDPVQARIRQLTIAIHGDGPIPGVLHD